MSYWASVSSCTSRALRASVQSVDRPLSVVGRALRHMASCSAILGSRIFSASVSSCTSRALRASVHTVHCPLSVVGRALRHTARCSAMLGCCICLITVVSLTPSAAARALRLMSYSASLSSCTSRALRASVHTVVRTPPAVGLALRQAA
eukprot:scaffold3430_cov258-Prasinococcus_capsulatus_cf.AAC.2